MTPVVGIVGFGEAGSAIAAGLASSGTTVLATDARLTEPDGERLRCAAAISGVEMVDDIATLVERATVILSLVTVSSAVPVAAALAKHTDRHHLVADLNSTSPRQAMEIAELVAASGATVADVAIMAAVPTRRHQVPMIASGPGARTLAELPLGLRVEVIGDTVGAASAVKLLRSLLVKGLEALLVEFGVAASRWGATEHVLRSLDGTLPTGDWEELATYLLSRTALHGVRRGRELEGAAAMLRDAGVEPLLAEAAARRLLWAAEQGLATRFGEHPPRHYDEVLTALDTGRRT